MEQEIPVLKVPLTPELRIAIESYAKQVGISMTDVGRLALHDYVQGAIRSKLAQTPQLEEPAHAS